MLSVIAIAAKPEIPPLANGFWSRVSKRALAYAMLMIIARDAIEVINLPAAGYMKDVLKLGPVGFAAVNLFNAVPGYFGPVYG
jgi:hypothetical protein